MPSLNVVGYGLVAFLLVGYFGWLCAEMSGHAGGGGAIAAIFGAMAIGVSAGAIGMKLGNAGRDH